VTWTHQSKAGDGRHSWRQGILGGWGREGSPRPWNSEVDVWKRLAIDGPYLVLWVIEVSPETPRAILDPILRDDDGLSQTAI